MFAQAYMGDDDLFRMLLLDPQRALEGASPRRFQPMYAWANMGHPSRGWGLVVKGLRGL